MRDKNRIKIILGKLEELWMRFPDMRFWQVIQILEIPKDKEGTDPFFWEDDLWEKIFNDTLKKEEG